MDKNLKSLYYYLPGQDPATTRVDERSKALQINPEGWDYVTRHLTKAEKEEQVIADEQARKQYLKEGSYNMTKHWDNSIEVGPSEAENAISENKLIGEHDDAVYWPLSGRHMRFPVTM